MLQTLIDPEDSDQLSKYKALWHAGRYLADSKDIEQDWRIASLRKRDRGMSMAAAARPTMRETLISNARHYKV